MLTSVAAPLLNQMARMCRTEWARQTFAESPEGLAMAEDRLYKEAQTRAPQRAAMAYATVMPLLLENRAISRFVAKTQRPDLRLALPEITTPSEAATLASMEFNLTPLEQRALLKLLQGDLPS